MEKLKFILRNKGMWRSVGFSLLQRVFRKCCPCVCLFALCKWWGISQRNAASSLSESNWKILADVGVISTLPSWWWTETKTKCKRSVSTNWFFFCKAWEGLEIRLWLAPGRPVTAVALSSACYRETSSALLAVIAVLVFPVLTIFCLFSSLTP